MRDFQFFYKDWCKKRSREIIKLFHIYFVSTSSTHFEQHFREEKKLKRMKWSFFYLLFSSLIDCIFIWFLSGVMHACACAWVWMDNIVSFLPRNLFYCLTFGIKQNSITMIMPLSVCVCVFSCSFAFLSSLCVVVVVSVVMLLLFDHNKNKFYSRLSIDYAMMQPENFARAIFQKRRTWKNSTKFACPCKRCLNVWWQHRYRFDRYFG